MLDETESQSEEVQPDEGQPEVEALEEAVWEPTGGGWYENSITGERVRGKKNIPFGTLLTTSAIFPFFFRHFCICSNERYISSKYPSTILGTFELFKPAFFILVTKVSIIFGFI